MTQERKHPGKVFLSVEEFRDFLSDYQIFDARFSLKTADYGRAEYRKGHAAHAIEVNVDEDLSGPIDPLTGRHPLPSSEHFVEWSKTKGISEDRPVLVYDDDCGAMGACRMWWMLDSLGVEAYVVNGGIQAYRAAMLPVETGEQTEKVSAVSFWPFRTEFTHCYSVREIPPNATLADARAANRFHSTVRPYGADAFPGHISGAVNIPYAMHIREVNDVRLLRDPDEIRSNILQALVGAWGGGKPDLSRCVFYCGSGLSACINLALARHLDLGQPFFYCGSWSEYAAVHRTPLVRGIVEEHGMWMEMKTANLGENPRVNLDVTPVLVDGTLCENADDDIRRACEHLHVGEKAIVYFKGGRTLTIEVPIRN